MSLDKKKLLLIDDDADTLDQQKLELEAKGYEVYTAETSEEGLQLFKDVKPDAIMLGLMIEEYDSGFILAHMIRKEPYGKHIPIFMVTSATYVTGFKFESTTEEEREWIKCDEIFNKPVQIDQLVQKLEFYFAERLV